MSDPFTRDRYGRPLIPDGHGTVVPYQRVSTFANTLDDKSGLLAWQAWMVLRGAQRDPALAVQAADADTTPKPLIDELAELGGSKNAAERGTDRHTLLSMRVQGEPLPDMPDDARRALERLYHLLTSLGTVAGVEVPIVCDEYQVAGSMDYLIRTPDGTPIVADLKTGRSVWPLSVPVQLYCYARGQHWDGEQRQGWVCDKPPRLVAIHAPQDDTPPRLLEVDLDVARTLTEHAAVMRTVRKQTTPKTIWKDIR